MWQGAGSSKTRGIHVALLGPDNDGGIYAGRSQVSEHEWLIELLRYHGRREQGVLEAATQCSELTRAVQDTTAEVERYKSEIDGRSRALEGMIVRSIGGYADMHAQCLPVPVNETTVGNRLLRMRELLLRIDEFSLCDCPACDVDYDAAFNELDGLICRAYREEVAR